MDYSTKMSKMKRARGIQKEDPRTHGWFEGKVDEKLANEVIRLRRRSPEEAQLVLAQEILQLKEEIKGLRRALDEIEKGIRMNRDHAGLVLTKNAHDDDLAIVLNERARVAPEAKHE